MKVSYTCLMSCEFLCERMQEIRKQMQHPVGGKIF